MRMDMMMSWRGNLSFFFFGSHFFGWVFFGKTTAPYGEDWLGHTVLDLIQVTTSRWSCSSGRMVDKSGKKSLLFRLFWFVFHTKKTQKSWIEKKSIRFLLLQAFASIIRSRNNRVADTSIYIYMKDFFKSTKQSKWFNIYIYMKKKAFGSWHFMISNRTNSLQIFANGPGCSWSQRALCRRYVLLNGRVGWCFWMLLEPWCLISDIHLSFFEKHG